MRSVERNFRYFQRKNPGWSTWVCFAETVHGRCFSKDTIRRLFNQLVDKDDYIREEKMQLLKYLYELSMRPIIEPSGTRLYI